MREQVIEEPQQRQPAPMHWLVYGLQEVREEQGLSLEQLAERSGVLLHELEAAERPGLDRQGLLMVDVDTVASVLQVARTRLWGPKGIKTPWWPGLEYSDWLLEVQAWDRAQDRMRMGGRNSKRGPSIKPARLDETTVPKWPAVVEEGPPPTIVLAPGRRYIFDGSRFRPHIGRPQVGGALPIFGFTQVREERGLSEHQVVREASLRWVDLRRWLYHEKFPTVQLWLRVWDVCGRPNPDDLLWGLYPALVPIVEWEPLRKKLESHTQKTPSWERLPGARELWGSDPDPMEELEEDDSGLNLYQSRGDRP